MKINLFPAQNKCALCALHSIVIRTLLLALGKQLESHAAFNNLLKNSLISSYFPAALLLSLCCIDTTVEDYFLIILLIEGLKWSILL